MSAPEPVEAEATHETVPELHAAPSATPDEVAPGSVSQADGPDHDPSRAAYDAAIEQALGASLFDFDDQPYEAAEGIASGYIPMEAKQGALHYQPAVAVRFGRLPNKVDLRRLMAPVEDRGGAASSVATAVASAYEYWIAKASKQSRELSALFVDYNARWRDGTQGQEGGSAIQLAMEALSKFGACSEAVWPADMRLVTKKPGADAYQDAAPARVVDLAQMPLRLQTWKQALAEGKPIIFGIALFEAFDACSDTGGVVPMPAPEEIPRSEYVLHAMCAVGYSDNEKVFIVRNPRGAAHWGDNGHCYLPYAYVMNPKLNDGDCWVFVPKTSMQPPREVWSDDTKPVTNGGAGVDFQIEAHTIEDYANVAVDLFEQDRRPFHADVGDDYARYVNLAGKGSWNEMDAFDYHAFLSEAQVDDAARHDS